MDEIRICDIESLEMSNKTYYVIKLGNIAIIENRLKTKKGKDKTNILKPFIKKDKKNGYKYIKVKTMYGKDKNIRVNRLIGLAFIDNPYGYKQVHHKDHNKLNNDVDNLEWVTGKRNINQMIEYKKIMPNQINIFGQVVKRNPIIYHTLNL